MSSVNGVSNGVGGFKHTEQASSTTIRAGRRKTLAEDLIDIQVRRFSMLAQHTSCSLVAMSTLDTEDGDIVDICGHWDH